MPTFALNDIPAALFQREGGGRISVGCTDWDGRLRLKQVPGEHLPRMLREGLAMTTAVFATDTAERPMTQGVFQDPARGYGDARLGFEQAAWFPDPHRCWGTDGLLLGALTAAHAQFCPRAQLVAELARWTALGLHPAVGIELECHMLAETPERLGTVPPSTLRVHPAFGRMYSDVEQAMVGDFLQALAARARACGISLGSVHAEFRGLLELTLSPATALEAADCVLALKSLLKILARRESALAVFMAQLSEEHEPAGMHFNLSLLDPSNGAPMFGADASTPGALMQAFLAGLQRDVPACFLALAPTVNSWKRFATASFVPTRNTWGIDNKTAAYRVIPGPPAEARIEVRLAGADVHPHLALTALLAAGRRGISAALQASPPTAGNAHLCDAPAGPDFPGDFRSAIARWRNTPTTTEIFGADFTAAYADSRDWQLARLERVVTDWEVRQFAECV